jgi:hypothetical protein
VKIERIISYKTPVLISNFDETFICLQTRVVTDKGLNLLISDVYYESKTSKYLGKIDETCVFYCNSEGKIATGDMFRKEKHGMTDSLLFSNLLKEGSLEST